MLNWTRSEMPSLPSGKTEVKGGTLSIRNLSPSDSGLYHCVATNTIGTKKVKMNLVVQLFSGIFFSYFIICYTIKRWRI